MKQRTIDMTGGSVVKCILLFAMPNVISGLLQIMYGAADSIVVGKFCGDASLAAVGSAMPASYVLVNLFFGLSCAVNIIVSRCVGAKNREAIKRAVHTSLAVSLIAGIILAILGIILSEPLLQLMDSPDDVIDLSATYLRIYFTGIPSSLVFNCTSAILYSFGDSRRPAMYLTFAGVLNLVTNILFVAVFRLGVVGAAMTTVVSQTFAAVLTVRLLFCRDSLFTVKIREIRIYKKELLSLIAMGLPAGLQSTVISLSNVFVQSCVNSCGKDVMAASTAANSLEGIIYIAIYAFFQTSVTFVSSNYGAGNFTRIKKGLFVSLVSAVVFGLILTRIMLFFQKPLLSMYTDSPYTVALAERRMAIVCATYFLCGIPEVLGGALRGLGAVNSAVMATILGECAVKFAMSRIGAPYGTPEELDFLFYSYPMSWILSGVLLLTMFIIQFRKLRCESVLVQK